MKSIHGKYRVQTITTHDKLRKIETREASKILNYSEKLWKQKILQNPTSNLSMPATWLCKPSNALPLPTFDRSFQIFAAPFMYLL